MTTTSATGLVFDPDTGVGFEPFAIPPQYDDAYFHKYEAYAQTTFGIALNALRVGLVSRYLTDGELLIDIGVGDGAFLRARCRPFSYGYDINPAARRMLIDEGRWLDVARIGGIQSASFWDALEHIEAPGAIVEKIAKYCFVSIPIFRDERHILASKHYRPTEHCWYFTRHGLIRWFWDYGFACQEMNDIETTLGREDIGTFVFRRVR